MMMSRGPAMASGKAAEQAVARAELHPAKVIDHDGVLRQREIEALRAELSELKARLDDTSYKAARK